MAPNSAQQDLARMLGGMLVAAAALALFIRKEARDDWGDFGRLLVLLVPCVLLYALALRGGRGGRAQPWRAVLFVLAIVLAPLTLGQFVETVGGDAGANLNVAWIFAATAGLAIYAAFGAGVSYGALLAALSLLVAWLAFWDEALDSPSAATLRWLLVVAAALLVAGAWALERRALRHAPELVTAAGIAALAAGVVGLVSLVVQLIGQSIAEVLGAPTEVGGAAQRQEWDLFLLAVALALIWYGARRGVRGPVYVGAVTLGAFVVSIGTEIVALVSGDSPEGGFFGWPFLLLVAGVAALLAGFRAERSEPSPERFS